MGNEFKTLGAEDRKARDPNFRFRLGYGAKKITAAKFYHDTITPLCPPNMRKCASSDSASFFFWFFRQPTAKTPTPIFTINTSNDAVSRKDVMKTKFYISTPFSPKNRKFWATFRRDLENFASKRP